MPNKSTGVGVGRTRSLLRDLAIKQTKRSQHRNISGSVPPGGWLQERWQGLALVQQLR